jgi:hypothetical protein
LLFNSQSARVESQSCLDELEAKSFALVKRITKLVFLENQQSIFMHHFPPICFISTQILREYLSVQFFEAVSGIAISYLGELLLSLQESRLNKAEQKKLKSLFKQRI